MEASQVVLEPARPAATAEPGRRWGRAWLPALVVLVAYGIWIGQYLGQGRDPRDFIRIKAALVRKAHSSAVIRYDPHYRYAAPRRDYDGQYYYLIALDPVHARDYIDEPVTRYERIAYPLLARFLALGRPALIPYTMVLINWIFLALGTWFVSLWLIHRRLSPWYATIYGFYAGLFIGLSRDLTDPMAYGLVALAVLLFDRGDGKGRALSALTFAIAALARETTLIFAAVYGLSLVSPYVGVTSSARARLGRALAFLAVAAGPFLIYAGILTATSGVNQNTQAALPQIIPFAGLLSYWPWNAARTVEAITVVIPALICLAMAVAALWRRLVTPAVLVLILNVLLFVVFASAASAFEYNAYGRYSEGVMLAALYCIPTFDLITRGRHWWLWTSAVGWLLLTPVQFLAYITHPLY